VAMNTPWALHDAMARHRPGRWLEEALCAQVDPEEFFPHAGQSGAKAKSVCRACPVQGPCLEFAVTSPVVLQGIWGGHSETERRSIRRLP